MLAHGWAVVSDNDAKKVDTLTIAILHYTMVFIKMCKK